MSFKVSLVEVGPRDGLQNEKKTISTATKLKLIQKLAAAGLKRIEIGAFVSPKWVPQMADSAALVRRIKKLQAAPQKKTDPLLAKDLSLSVLVPNQKGLDLALSAAGANSHGATRGTLAKFGMEISIFGAASESFSHKNINCSIAESFNRFEEVVHRALKQNIKVRGYLSTCFYCPYEGAIDPHRVIDLAVQLKHLGVYEVSIGDTIGAATPGEVRRLLKDLIPAMNGTQSLAMHFHDTRGTALANILASLDAGITTFDSSLGGLGGCPYAPGASGNVGTEDIVFLLQGMGIETGIDISELIQTNHWMTEQIKRTLPSKIGKVGLLTAKKLNK